MVNFKLGDKFDKDEIMNMTRAWDKEKIWVPDGNLIHSLPNFFSWLFYLYVQEAMDSITVGDSDFFFVPRSCHVDYLFFITC